MNINPADLNVAERIFYNARQVTSHFVDPDDTMTLVGLLGITTILMCFMWGWVMPAIFAMSARREQEREKRDE